FGKVSFMTGSSRRRWRAAELRDAFARHVVDLLVLAIGATRDATEMARSRGGRAARLHAIKENIANALSRPDLSVSLIAPCHKIPPQYVQVFFEQPAPISPQSVVGRRLGAPRRALTDQARAGLAISAVAYGCGFADLSNFNRAFRRRFGCTPGDVR